MPVPARMISAQTMAGGAVAPGSVVHFAGLCLGQSDHVPQVLHRIVRVRHHHDGGRTDVGQMLEILDRIVGQVGHHGRIDDDGAGRSQDQRVTVRRRLLGRFHRDDTRGARLVVDDHGLSEGGAELLRQGARHQIGTAARRERHDQADRLARPFGVGRLRNCGRRHAQGQSQGERPPEHSHS